MPPTTLRLVKAPAPDATETVARATAGDRWAQEQLFREHVQFVGHVARAAGAEADLEDVVQETFLAAFASLARLSEPSALRPWLARLTVRQVQRRNRFRPWLHLFGGDREEHLSWERLVDPAASAEALADVRHAERALASAGQSARLCWLLRHWHGMTLEETAVAASLSLATTKRRLQQAEQAVAQLRQETAP
jgi:RNA polymerase sigma-70 factor (ECF subfamily)